MWSHFARRSLEQSNAMRPLLCLAVALVCLLAATPPLGAQTKQDIVPEDWLPALAPSIKSSLADLSKAESQAAMNTLSREVAEMTDAQLFIAYVRLYQRLSTKERAALFTEQTKWLQKRAKAAKDAQAKGGSLAPLEANNAEVTLTEKRLDELRARFKAAQK